LDRSLGSIVEFSWKVITGFLKNRLLEPLILLGGVVQRHQEADYQDEFSRSCHRLTLGRVKTYPEFGGRKGRVDFYVVDQRWAIELLRDGSDLRGHASRFETGGKYETQMPIADYIILDFRENTPRRKHSGLFLLVKHPIQPAERKSRASETLPCYFDEGPGGEDSDGFYDEQRTSGITWTYPTSRLVL
jgi:hypothetical protein